MGKLCAVFSNSKAFRIEVSIPSGDSVKEMTELDDSNNPDEKCDSMAILHSMSSVAGS